MQDYLFNLELGYKKNCDKFLCWNHLLKIYI